MQDTAPQQEQTSITIQDLIAVRSLIEICSQRGSFKASELAAVGSLYDRLNGFLQVIEKSSQQPTEDTPTADSAAPTGE